MKNKKIKKILLSIALAFMLMFSAFGLTGCGLLGGGGNNEPVPPARVYVESISIVEIFDFNYTQWGGVLVQILPNNATDRTFRVEIVAEQTTAPGATLNDMQQLRASAPGVIAVRAISNCGGLISEVAIFTVTEVLITGITINNERTALRTVATFAESFNSTNLNNASWRRFNEYGITQTQFLTGVSTANSGYNHIRITTAGDNHGIELRNPIRVNPGDVLDWYVYARRQGTPLGGTAGVTAPLSVRYALSGTWDYVRHSMVNQHMPQTASYTQFSRRITIDSEWDAWFRMHIFRGPTGGGVSGNLDIDDITIYHRRPTIAFSSGGSVTFNSTIMPANATNNNADVTFEIVTQGTTAAGAGIDGNVLTATGEGVVRVRARTACFNGEIFYVLVTQ